MTKGFRLDGDMNMEIREIERNLKTLDMTILIAQHWPDMSYTARAMVNMIFFKEA